MYYFYIKTSILLRRLLPRFVTNILSRIFNPIGGVINFAFFSGYLFSCLKKKVVDNKNNPIPWFTYPCIDFLTNQNFKKKKVLELGAGYSSIWWAKRCESIVSIENNEKWINKLKKLSPPPPQYFFCFM